MTAPGEAETHSTSRRLSRRLTFSVGLVVLSGLLVGALFAWSAPRTQVPVPGPNAEPEDVVLTYLEAVKERDFDTANAIDARPDSDLGRFSKPMRASDVSDVRVTGSRRIAHVTFKAELSGTGASMDDGRQWWGYVLERGTDNRWHIVDEGVG